MRVVQMYKDSELVYVKLDKDVKALDASKVIIDETKLEAKLTKQKGVFPNAIGVTDGQVCLVTYMEDNTFVAKVWSSGSTIAGKYDYY